VAVVSGRPPLPIGAWGNIKCREVEPGVWKARARFRDADGVTRPVERHGKSSTAARNTLLEEFSKRRRAGGSELTGESTVADAAELQLARWQAQANAGKVSPNTLRDYESSLRLHVLPGLGAVRLREATAGRCETWWVRLQTRAGAATARRARAVLSGVLGLAVRMDALSKNPVRELSPIEVSHKPRPSRSLTAAERAEWLGWLDTHVARDPSRSTRQAHTTQWPIERTIASRALGDISRLMLGTGVRVGEAMAISWDEVDFDAPKVAICWHLVRVKGKGIVRQPGAKSAAGDRVIELPSWCVTMLRQRRLADPVGYPVFPDALGGWRDPNLVIRWLRWSRDEAGLDWFTSHRFRQTVITHLDQSGARPREVADHVGHSKIAQTQGYMARKIASSETARHLESMLDPPLESSA
jgi:integrase